MKIAIVCGRDIERASDTDGGSVLIRNLARELCRQGNSIDVYTPANIAGGTFRQEEHIEPSHDLPGVSIIRFPIQEKDFHLRTLDKNSESYFLNRMSISMRAGEYFDDRKLHAYDRIYLFHITHAFGLFEKDRCPISRTVLFQMFLGAFYCLSEDVPQEYFDAEIKALKYVQHIATPSAAERTVLINSYKVPSEKIFIVRRGYDPSVFRPLLRTFVPQDTLHILCANVIKPQKEQCFFLDLVEAARDRIPGLTVHLIGLGETNTQTAYGHYAFDLKCDATRRGLDQYFVFHDIAPQYAVNELMRTCHLAFYPSRTETFGKSVLESVVTGLPTIVFNDVPAYDEFLENHRTGISINRSLAAALEAIDMLRTDAKLYETISENGIAIAPQFTWEKIVADFIRDSEAHIRL